MYIAAAACAFVIACAAYNHAVGYRKHREGASPLEATLLWLQTLRERFSDEEHAEVIEQQVRAPQNIQVVSPASGGFGTHPEQLAKLNSSLLSYREFFSGKAGIR